MKVWNFPNKDREHLIKYIRIAEESGKEVIWLHSRGEVANYLQKVRKVPEEVQKEQRQPVEVALASR